MSGQTQSNDANSGTWESIKNHMAGIGGATIVGAAGQWLFSFLGWPGRIIGGAAGAILGFLGGQKLFHGDDNDNSKTIRSDGDGIITDAEKTLVEEIDIDGADIRVTTNKSIVYTGEITEDLETQLQHIANTPRGSDVTEINL